jgi:hypothetical protein
MKRCVACLVVFSALACVAQAQEAARVVLEAESFRPGPGWRVIRFGENYFHCAIGSSYFSRERLLSASEQGAGAQATRTARIPRAARYKVWIHYEAPYSYNTCFGLRIEQGGRVVFDEPYGGATHIRTWPFGSWNQAQFNPGYGGGDNAAWEGIGHEADLRAGSASFTLYTLGNPEPSAKRNVDVVFLTTDLSDKPANPYDPLLDDLRMPGGPYLRVTNLGAAPMWVEARLLYNRRPWGQGIGAIGKSGLLRGAGGEVRDIPPGASTVWVDLGPLMDTVHQNGLTLSRRGEPAQAPMQVVVEIASRPDGKHLLRRIRYLGDSPQMGIVLPVDLNPREILTYEEVAEKQLAYVRAFPDKGRQPQKILFYGGVGAADASGATRLGKLQFELKRCLGYNTLLENGSPEDLRRLGLQPARVLTYLEYRLDTSEAHLQQIHQQFEASGRLPYLRSISLGDEVGLSEYVPREGRDERFREYLQRKGLSPADVGASSWDDVRLGSWEVARDNPVLYYETEDFLAAYGLEGLRQMTDRIRRIFGEDILIGANFSPHPFYWPNTSQWVDVFRGGGASMPWTEDYLWQVPVASAQMAPWLVDAFRAAARDRDLTIRFYVMPHSPGNNDTDFRLIHYAVLGHGAKVIDHFSIGPQHYCTENYVDWRDVSRYRQIHDIMREVGQVDDLLYDGRVRRAEVALLLSNTTDTWELAWSGDRYNIVEDNPNSNAYNFERQATWLALRHAQSPVDLITEEDAVDGVLAHYKVLYLAGDHLRRDAARAVADWVRGGGILFSCAGGGFRDEYNRPLETLYPVFGIRDQQLEKRDIHLRPKMEVPRLKPLDTIKVAGTGLPSFQMEALAFKQKVAAAEGSEVVGTFSDGSPAILRNRCGAGQAILVATLPGMAYLKSAIPVRPMDRGAFAHFLPTAFSAEVRSLFDLPLRLAKLTKPVECSEPLVDASIVESDKGIVIPLANFTGKPIKHLRVTLRDVGEPRRIRTTQQGELKARRGADGLVVEFPIGLTDFLVLER